MTKVPTPFIVSHLRILSEIDKLFTIDNNEGRMSIPLTPVHFTLVKRVRCVSPVSAVTGGGPGPEYSWYHQPQETSYCREVSYDVRKSGRRSDLQE